MSQEAAEAFAKALRLLDEAGRVDAEQVPEMVVHTAYYAMYHGARAALLTKNRNVTTQHQRLPDALRKASSSPGVAEAAALLRSAYPQRISADYDTGFQPDAALAADALRDARRFIELCRTEFKLDAAAAPEEKPRGPSS